MTELLVDDALTALAAHQVAARWEQMGGNIGAVIVDIDRGATEVAIGDSEDLLTYSDGPRQALLGLYNAAVYTTDGDQLEDLGEFGSAEELATAVRQALDRRAGSPSSERS